MFNVVIVTSASHGVGRFLAIELAKSGAKLMLAGDDPYRLASTAARCREEGADVVCFAGDLNSPIDCKALMDATIHRFSAIDMLLLNYGIRYFGPPISLDNDPETVEITLRNNLCTPLLLASAALPHIIESTSGSKAVIFVESISAQFFKPNHAACEAARAGLSAYEQSLQAALQEKGIRVQALFADNLENDGEDRGNYEQLSQAREMQSHAFALTVKEVLSSSAGNCPNEDLAYSQSGLGGRNGTSIYI